MSENKELDLAARREWALEQTARDLGISVGELKRKLALERQIKAARTRGDNWMIPMLMVGDTSFVQDIVRDNQAPTGPSSQGIIPSSQQLSNVRPGGGGPGGGTGWGYVAPIKNGLGEGK